MRRHLSVSVVLGLLMHSAAVAAAFDHSAFDTLLRAHVRAGLVDYDAFGSSAAFEGYLEALAAADVASLSRDARLAFWINAYNAWTIELINAHEERESIRNINKTLGLLSLKGPWSEPIVRVSARVLTLDEVEHEIIRPEFREPRIHFALVCAALGCPPLREEAYVGPRLETQLADQARRFLIHSPDQNRLDVGARTLFLSPIFDWYKEDFGTQPQAVGRYLAGIHPPGPARDLLVSGDFRIEWTPYDWTLNLLR